MLNQERNLKTTSLAQGKRGTYKQTNKQTNKQTAATATSKGRDDIDCCFTWEVDWLILNRLVMFETVLLRIKNNEERGMNKL